MSSAPVLTLTIDQYSANQRLDRFCRKFYKPHKHIPLSIIYQWIRKGEIKLNGKKANEKTQLQVKDELRLPDPGKADSIPAKKQDSRTDIALEDIRPFLLKEDEHRLVWNKPAGVTMHSNQDSKGFALDDYLKSYVEKTQIQTSDTFRPSFCFRLDKDTSGIVIAAKTYASLQHLNECIRERHTSKMYLACVVGTFPKHMTHDASLHKVVDKKFGRGKMVVDEERGKACHSESWLFQQRHDPILGDISLVKVKITTGRMHQIRVHLAHAGFPVLGDMVYGIPSVNRKLFKKFSLKRHLLHCWQYGFADMNGQDVAFETKVPQEMELLFPGL